MEGGEEEGRNGKLPKKKRSILDRGFEAILGAFLAYLSGSATGLVQATVLVAGIVFIIHALFAD